MLGDIGLGVIAWGVQKVGCLGSRRASHTGGSRRVCAARGGGSRPAVVGRVADAGACGRCAGVAGVRGRLVDRDHLRQPQSAAIGAGVDVHDQLHLLGREREYLWGQPDDHDPSRSDLEQSGDARDEHWAFSTSSSIAGLIASANYCQYSASLTVPPSGGPAFTLIKSVQGDLDPGPKFAPGIGDASPSGSGIYTLQWSNTGGQSLSSPVIYDILPYIGDTGVSENQAGVARGSQFATSFAGISGALPGGVTVAYSESTNPCRPEVFPNAGSIRPPLPRSATRAATALPPRSPAPPTAHRSTAPLAPRARLSWSTRPRPRHLTRSGCR
jgi:hypothetical protein